jgi:hypothetical protein
MARPGEFSRRARDYFTSAEDDYVFAFRSVCQYLNVNPHHILILVGLEENPRKRPDVADLGWLTESVTVMPHEEQVSAESDS